MIKNNITEETVIKLIEQNNELLKKMSELSIQQPIINNNNYITNNTYNSNNNTNHFNINMFLNEKCFVKPNEGRPFNICDGNAITIIIISCLVRFHQCDDINRFYRFY